MGSRLAWYAGISTAAAAGVILSAFNQRANFYSACVYLAQSNLCLMIIINLILFLFSSFMYGLQRLCYGPLRPIEIEQLYEKAWFAVTETCLAMTIFREEVGAWFLVMFVALLTGKVWGWIGDGRVEILEQQPPANPRLFHIRLSISLAISVIYDAWLMGYTVETVIRQARPNMMVMFLFEFAVLTTSSLSTACRYGISLEEQRIVKKQTEERLAERRREVRAEREEILRQREAAANTEGEENNDAANRPLPSEDDIDEMDIEVPGWEGKGQWVLTLDLITDFMKLLIYTSFFFILLTFYGLPIHIMRDLFVTARSFLKRLTAFIRYRRATHDMNKRYPDATVEDIQREDTCIICREDMRPWSVTNPPAPAGAPARPGAVNERNRPKKLPCGHILHLGCLKSWLERQQVCPTCRRPVVETAADPNAANAANPPNAAQNPNDQRMRWPDDQGEPRAPAAPPQPANRGRGGMRMINLGPLRVGFGQGNLNDLAGFRDPAGQAGLDGAGANPGPRVYGMELGFPRRAQPQPQPQPQEPNHNFGQNSSPASPHIEQQLQEIEQRIVSEIRALQLTQQELQITNLLQAELVRLRAIQNSNQDPLAANFAVPVLPPMPTLAPIPPFAAPNLTRPLHVPQMQRHGPRHNTSAIPSGSADLPPGVVIPEGWSLLPLQRIGNSPTPHAGPSATQGASEPSTNGNGESGLSDASASTVTVSPTQNDAASINNPDSERALAHEQHTTPMPSIVNAAVAEDSSDDTNNIHTPPSVQGSGEPIINSGTTTSVSDLRNWTAIRNETEGEGGDEGESANLPNWSNSQLFSGPTLTASSSPGGEQNNDTGTSLSTDEAQLQPKPAIESIPAGESSSYQSRDNTESDESDIRRREKGKARSVMVEDVEDDEDGN
ncbi:E3 ubiquitin-protein ligase hrd1 [Clarireedia jacksonii]